MHKKSVDVLSSDDTQDPILSKMSQLEIFSQGRAANHVPYIRQAVSQENGDTSEARK